MNCEACGEPINRERGFCTVCRTPVHGRAPRHAEASGRPVGPLGPVPTTPPFQAASPGFPPSPATGPPTGPLREHPAEPRGTASPPTPPPGPPREGQALSGRPLRFRSSRAWLLTGMLRSPRGVLAALLGAWFNLPGALFLAAFGLLVGAIAGSLGGALEALEVPVAGDLISSGMLQIGGMFGALLGAVFGAIAGLCVGLFGLWFTMFIGSPALALAGIVGQVVAGFFLGVLYTIGYVWAEPLLVRISGARRLSRREAELIMPIVGQCAAALGIRRVPRVCLDDSREPNAAAWTRHIVVNQGLLDEFTYDPEVLAAALSHELTHWNNADPVFNVFIAGVALPVTLIANAATAVLRFFHYRPFVQIMVWLFTWPFLVTLRLFIAPMQAADARAAEFRCDQGAVVTGHRAGMRRCLARLRSTLDGARSGWDIAVCATHPPNELRLEALEEPGVRYPLPDPESPARPLPVTVTSALEKD